jgi:hypothetical protein
MCEAKAQVSQKSLYSSRLGGIEIPRRLIEMLQPFFLKVRITAQPFSGRIDNEA